jgi:hypothetical protein
MGKSTKGDLTNAVHLVFLPLPIYAELSIGALVSCVEILWHVPIFSSSPPYHFPPIGSGMHSVPSTGAEFVHMDAIQCMRAVILPHFFPS